MHPIDIGVQTQGLRRIEKTEEIRTISSYILKSDSAVKLILVANSLIETRLQRVQMAIADYRNLIVI